MNASMVTPHEHAVKHNRFVAATEFEQGKHNYRCGLPLASCVTPDMEAGWVAAEEAGFKAHCREQMRGRRDDVAVNWRGERISWAEVN